MSITLTDSEGRRYRLTHGWSSQTCSNQNLFRGQAQAQAFVSQLAPEQESEIFQVFFGGPDHRPRHLRTHQANASAVSGPAFGKAKTNAERIADAIEHSQLIVKEDDTPEPVDDKRALLQVKIRHALNDILITEKQEAARLQALMDQETTLGKSLIYTGAAMTGLGKAAWGLIVWAKDVSDLVNPVVRLHNQYKSARSAWGSDNFTEKFAENQLNAEWREVVEVIGFDPSKITQKQLAEAMDAADTVWSDSTLRGNLKDFAWNYAKAQHAVELTEMGGGAAFEIILTAILAAVTGGVGLFAATAAKARHVTKFRKLGELLVDFSKASKQMAKYVADKSKRAAKSVKRSFDDVKTDMPAQTKAPDGPDKSKKKVARTAAQDREAISKLSNEAAAAEKKGDLKLRDQKINEARAILKPLIPEKGNSSPDAWAPFIERLDVSSPKDGAVFWSGARDGADMAAERFAEAAGGVRLETTPGGRVMNGWDSLNKDLPWDGKGGGTPPYGSDAWGAASKKYAEGATGKINVIQSPYAANNGGGPTWQQHEAPTIQNGLRDGTVSEVNFFVYDNASSTLSQVGG